MSLTGKDGRLASRALFPDAAILMPARPGVKAKRPLGVASRALTSHPAGDFGPLDNH